MPARLLPQGWIDLLRQIVLFCGAYWLYQLTRGFADGRADVALDHAHTIIRLERELGLFVEPAINRWASEHEWIADAASWMYVNAHFAITTIALAYIYLRRNRHFYFVRNMFLVAMAIALLGYALFPTAPPRLVPGWGFADSVQRLTGVRTDASSVLFNPFAAVPSMHVAFALMLGLAMAGIVRRPWARMLWRAYPLAVTFVVIATANHWWFDAAAGAAAAAVAALAADGVFARVRPDAWAWEEASRPARA